MTTLNKYFSSNNSYHPPPKDSTILVAARVPPFYEEKVKRIIEVKGYSSEQDYFNALFNENRELEDVIIPYEILKIVDEDYNTLRERPPIK